jgi:hypothetical protein
LFGLAAFLSILNKGLYIFGITLSGTYVTFPTLNVSIFPYFLGEIWVDELIYFSLAFLTGINVTPSIVIGLRLAAFTGT